MITSSIHLESPIGMHTFGRMFTHLWLCSRSSCVVLSHRACMHACMRCTGCGQSANQWRRYYCSCLCTILQVRPFAGTQGKACWKEWCSATFHKLRLETDKLYRYPSVLQHRRSSSRNSARSSWYGRKEERYFLAQKLIAYNGCAGVGQWP